MPKGEHRNGFNASVSVCVHALLPAFVSDIENLFPCYNVLILFQPWALTLHVGRPQAGKEPYVYNWLWGQLIIGQGLYLANIEIWFLCNNLDLLQAWPVNHYIQVGFDILRYYPRISFRKKKKWKSQRR